VEGGGVVEIKKPRAWKYQLSALSKGLTKRPSGQGEEETRGEEINDDEIKRKPQSKYFEGWVARGRRRTNNKKQKKKKSNVK